MADLVNEIISPEAQKQLDFTSDQLDLLTKQVAELAQAGKAIQFDFKGAKDFAFADEVIKKATASVEQFDSAQKALNKQVLDSAKALQLEAKANLDNARASTEAAKQKEIEARYTAALTKEKERLEAQLDKESKAAAKLGNDYEILKKAYIEAANRAKNLGVTLGVNSAQFKEASASAMKMHQVLLKVETAVGQSQRNVGNYTGSLMALSQVIREAPSFANGLRTGLSAIGNNMPILIDEFNKLKTEVGGTGKAMLIMGKSLFSFTNMFVLAFTALQFLQIYLSQTKKATNEYADSLNNLDKQAKVSAIEEMSRVSTLVNLAKDESVARDVRLRAVKELQAKYPDYLGNLSKEAILSGNITKEVEKLNEALFNKALMESATKKIGANADKWFDLKQKIDEAKTKQQEYQADVDRFNKAQEKYRKEGGLQPVAFTGAQARHRLGNVTDEIKDLQSQMTTLEKEADKFKKQRDEFAKLAGFAAVDDPDKKKRGPRENKEFKGTEELAKAQYELDKQRIEQSQATNKAISDDVEKGIQDRLNAYMQYQSDTLELAAMERDKEIAVENAKIDEYNRLEKDATGKRLQDLQLLEKAADLRKKAAIEKFNKESQGVTEDGRKEILAIIRTSNEQWIKDQTEAFQKIESAELDRYQKEERSLADALERKEITRKEYDKAVAVLQSKQHIAFLQAEIAFDEKLLQNDKLTADQRLKIENDRNAKYKQLIDAQNKDTAIANPAKKVGRITDPIANMLLPEGAFKDDLQSRENYLNEFYNQAINLANQAADAIIQAQNRQFDDMLKQLDTEKEAIKTNAQLKEDAINAGTSNAIQKQNEISKLHAQTAIQEQQIEEKKRKVEQERARFERAAAIAGIIQSTAVAIAGALKYGPGAPAIIALIAAAGAAQLAAVASSPIPAYKEGTAGHKGGLFIAGDGGEPEFIKAPGKSGYWSASKSTLYNEASGTTVTPLSKIMSMDATRMGSFVGSDSTSALNALGNKITDKLDESIEATIFAARMNRMQQQNNDALAFELKKQRKLQ